MQELRNSLKFADGKAIKSEVDIQVFDVLQSIGNDDIHLEQKVKKKKNISPSMHSKYS